MAESVTLRRRNQVAVWWVIIGLLVLIALLGVLGVIGPADRHSLADRLFPLVFAGLGLFLYFVYVFPRVILNERGITVIDFLGWTTRIPWEDVDDVVDDGGIVIERKSGKRVRAACISPTGFDRLLPGYEDGTSKFLAVMHDRLA